METMIKCKAISDFTLKDFDKLTNIKRKAIETPGKIYTGDEFTCTEEMAKYLTGGNDKGKVVVKVIEVLPIKATIKYDENKKVGVKIKISKK